MHRGSAGDVYKVHADLMQTVWTAVGPRHDGAWYPPLEQRLLVTPEHLRRTRQPDLTTVPLDPPPSSPYDRREQRRQP